MSRFISALAAVLCFGMGLAISVPAKADAAADAKKAISANIAKMTAAINKKDVKTFMQFYADDAVLIDRRGERKTKQQSMAQINALLQRAKSVKFANKIEKFSLQKENAVVTLRESGTFVLPNPNTGKDSKLVAMSVEVTRWTRSGSGWKIKQTKETAAVLSIDGQPVQLPK